MAMFENFPYTDMHNLNLDWIIKIAKDFLDQYTSLQQMISDGEQSLQDLTSDGLQQLEEKADNLESLLQAWYDTHSQDIADQLADAIQDLNAWYTQHEAYLNNTLEEKTTVFNSRADAKTAQCIASIPSDYTDLSNRVTSLELDTAYINPISAQDVLTILGYTGDPNGRIYNSTDTHRSDFIPVKAGQVVTFSTRIIGSMYSIAFYREKDASTFVTKSQNNYGSFTAPEDGYIIFSCMDSASNPFIYTEWLGDFAKKVLDPSIDYADYARKLKLNLYDYLTIPQYIDTQGAFVNTNDTHRTDFIKVNAGDVIYYKVRGVAGFDVLAFYSKPTNQNDYVTGITGVTPIGSFVAPSDGFICVCCLDSFTEGYLYIDCKSDYVKQMVLNKTNLAEKYVVNLGDSLASGAGNSGIAYAKMYAQDRQASVLDYSVAGTPLANYGQSVSVTSVVAQTRLLVEQHPTDPVEIIFVEGGINDLKLWQFTPGTITDNYTNTDGDNTFSGALETIFKTLRNTYPTAKILFVTYHHMPVGTLAKQNQEYEIFKEVCKKWAVPIADVFAEGELNSNIQGMAETYFGTNPDEMYGRDIAHPNAEGYKKFYLPLIEKIYN